MKEYNSNLETVIALTLLAGVALIPLLALGLTVGVGVVGFSIFVVPHLLLLTTALIIGIKTVFFKNELTRSLAPLLFSCFAIFFIITFLFTFIPITARDALIHHLAVPKWWIATGQITEISWHSWSYYPMLIQLAYTWFELFGLTALTPLYHSFYLFLLASVVALIIKELGYSSLISIATFFVTITIPVALNLATTPLVDLPLALYSTVAVYLATKIVSESKNISNWCWCGVAVGLTLSIKPNGFLFAACFGACFLLQLLSEKVKAKDWLFGALLSALIAIAIYAPWAIKNYFWTGNPLYPIYGSNLLGEVISAPSKHSFTPLQARMIFYDESIKDILLLPFRIFTEGKEGSPVTFDGMLSPILLLCFIPLLGRKGAKALKLHYYLGLLFLISALLTGPARVRYLAPLYGSWVLLTVTFLATLRPVLIVVGLSIHFLIGIAYFSGLSSPLSYLLNKQETESYLSQKIPEWQAIEFVNKNLSNKDKLYLIMTGNRFYYYQVPIMTSGYQSESLLLKEIGEASDHKDLMYRFKKRGITHLLGHAPRIAEILQNLLSNEKKQLWNDFAQYNLKSMYSSNGFVVWTILN